MDKTPDLIDNSDEANEGFPDAEEISTLIGADFSMPEITTENPDSAPTAEPEPIEDEETGESYYPDDSDGRYPNSDTSRETDRKGRPFDPQLHATDENGNPKYSKKGYFVFLRKDKRGSVDVDAPKKAEYMETALLYFDGGVDALAGILGDHWKPANDDQRKAVARSIARYLESENSPAMTPKQEMLLRLGLYSAPRVTHTTTLDNAKLIIQKCSLGIRSFWATLTGKKSPKRQKVELVNIAEEIPNADNPSHNQ